jgi:hypothetical protein
MSVEHLTSNAIVMPPSDQQVSLQSLIAIALSMTNPTSDSLHAPKDMPVGKGTEQDTPGLENEMSHER